MSKYRKYEPKVYIPCCSVSPSQINFYSYPADGFTRSARFASNMANLDDNEHNGYLSAKAKKKFELALNWLLFNAKPKPITMQDTGKRFSFKVNFITLTLPAKQVHTDQEIKDVCLNNFITVARKKGLRNYIWRAEAQPATGNIHFHLITDMFIHYEDIRRWWNQSVELLGYIQEYQRKFHHTNPNSIDVHAVKHVRKLAPYLSKYCTKNRAFACIGELRNIKGKVTEVLYKSEMYRNEEGNRKQGKVIGHILGARIRPIEGRLWSCSQSLSSKKTLIFDGEEFQMKPLFEFVQQSDFYLHKTQWCDSYFGEVAREAEVWFPFLYNEMKSYFAK